VVKGYGHLVTRCNKKILSQTNAPLGIQESGFRVQAISAWSLGAYTEWQTKPKEDKFNIISNFRNWYFSKIRIFAIMLHVACECFGPTLQQHKEINFVHNGKGNSHIKIP
jgi:hypothetical protein